MADMANIVVKAANGTTDVTMVKVQPAGGDGQPAMWREDAASGAPGQKPALSVTSRWNGPKTARRVEASFKGHQTYTDTTTGLLQVANTLPISLSAVVPQGMPTAVADEIIARAVNSFASALFKQMLREGYAAT